MLSRKPRRQVSGERKSLHAAGLALQVLGGIVVVASFIGFASAGMSSVRSFGDEGSPFAWMTGFVLGGVATAVGAGMRRVAARGVAGSGLVLDPERARDDLEPWARTGGGLVRDALDEVGIDELGIGELGIGGDPRRDDPVVMVRCRECETLNDEEARFCDACGGKL